MKKLIVLAALIGSYASAAPAQDSKLLAMPKPHAAVPVVQSTTSEVPLTLMGHTLGEEQPTVPPVDRATCFYKSATKAGNFDTSNCPKFDFTFNYENGKLAKFSGLMHSRLISSAIEKLGKPTKDDTLTMHNGFGAEWTDRIYTWTLPNGYVTLYEDNGPESGISGLSDITVMTTDRHEKEQAELKQLRSNPL